MICHNCAKRKKCKKICKYAEQYANQDYVPQNYALLGRRDSQLPQQNWPAFYASPQCIFLMFFLEKKSGLEIAKKLKVSHQYVYQTIKKLKLLLVVKNPKSPFFDLL